ncbi:MAG: trypsin-like peptidase domain-containing protein [candidate division Zixibacteria bacterium]|nr:trypsin-like peptidase domain-containing protein [candidate division Zixibacteria bacterium]
MLKKTYWIVLIFSFVLNLIIACGVNSSEVDQKLIKEWSQTVGLILIPAEYPKNYGTFFVCESETGFAYGITAHHLFLPKVYIDSLNSERKYTTATAYYSDGNASRKMICNISQSFPDYDVVNFYPDSSEIAKNSQFTFTSLKYSDLDSATEIRLLDEVIYFGFPHGLGASFTERRNDPVVRKTVVSLVSSNSNYFWIQSLAGKGSSGSPVYSLRTKKLVGMVLSIFKDRDTDLTKVLRADRIRQLLKR